MFSLAIKKTILTLDLLLKSKLLLSWQHALRAVATSFQTASLAKLRFAGCLLIKFYQATAGIRQPCCRFHPSCSQYALEALEKYGIIKGLWLSFKRIVSCHPFGKSGYDPVK